jgi:hypothetical protein
MAGFCIDESSFRQIADLPIVIGQLNHQLSTIHNQHRQTVFKSWELDYVEVNEGVEFCDLLYSGELNLIDHDERILLIQTIDRCIVWDDAQFKIPDGEILLNGEATGSASIMFVATKALAADAIGIISLPLEGRGECSASVGPTPTKVYQVGLSTRLEPFYRFQMGFEKVSREEFTDWVPLAFPRLRFALEISSQIRRFQQKYDDIRDTIVDHLATLNDDFLSLLLEGHRLADVCDRVKSTRGVVISPESPNTHGNASAMREREVSFRGEKIVCEFHTKLHPTHDRIHFSPSVRSDTDENKFLVVGPFAEHLTV